MHTLALRRVRTLADACAHLTLAGKSHEAADAAAAAVEGAFAPFYRFSAWVRTFVRRTKSGAVP